MFRIREVGDPSLIFFSPSGLLSDIRVNTAVTQQRTGWMCDGECWSMDGGGRWRGREGGGEACILGVA